MADTCVYTLLDKTGNPISLAGRAALKTYLFDGGLEHLFPKRAVPALISAQFSRPSALPEKINIDGVERHTRNSAGNPIAQTEEEIRNFWKWFGNSQVVDEQGRPQIIYHGTHHDFTVFDTGKAGEKDHGWYGTGIYMTPDSATASAYADYDEEQSGQHVIPLYAKIESPFDWEQDMAASKTKGQSDEFTKLLQKSGHDGVFVENKYAAPEHAKRYEIVAFNPEQVKSATGNNGFFDPGNADIRYSRTENASAGKLTEAEARQHLADNFGVGIENLSRQGVLNFTTGKEAWPPSAKKGARGDEEAVYLNGKVYVDLSATPRSRLNAVVLHEIGEHFGLRRMLGPQAYHSLQEQITNRAKIAGSKAEAVWNEVKANYGHLEEGSEPFVAEVIAKLGESNFKAPWYRRLISQIKAFLMRMGLARGVVAGTITEADMHDLLVASLRSSAVGKVKDKAQYFGGAMASVPAWHGTPHTVDKFDSSKIGTGEGAQAFGYGLYFTDARRIAEWYKEKLTKDTPAYNTYKGEKITEASLAALKSADPVAHWVLSLLGNKATNVNDLVYELDSLVYHYENEAYRFKKYGPEYADRSAAHAKTAKAIEAVKDEVKHFAKEKNSGKLYQVELKPEEDEFLDWDKPLSEQSDKVKAALDKAELQDKDNAEIPKAEVEKMRGKDIYKAISRAEYGDDEASKYLHSIGIRGVRYKAEGGKSDANNYVIFSDEDVSITAQYSRPAVFDKIMRDEMGEPTLAAQTLEKFDEKWNDVAKQRFAALSVRHMIENAKYIMPGLSEYETLFQKRQAEDSSWYREASRLVSEVWRKLAKPELHKLAKVMHDSTLEDIDASLDWTGYREADAAEDGTPTNQFTAYTQEFLTPSRKEYLAREAMKAGAVTVSEAVDPKDPKSYIGRRGFTFKTEQAAADFVKYLEQQVKMQREERAKKGWPDKNTGREAAHNTARAGFLTLDPKAQAVYSEANKMHDKLSGAFTTELENRITSAVANGQKRKMLLAQIREKFESNSLNWYYAPLSRFGDEWFYGETPNGERWFETFKSESAKQEGIEKFEAMGGRLIGKGSSLKNVKLLEGTAASDAFILDIQKMIDSVQELGPELGDKLKDQIYQMYLATLPDVSIRQNRMHRAGTLGFNEDAMQAFSNAMHHGAAQLANMKYGRDMRAVLDQHIRAKELAERPDRKKLLLAENDAADMLKADWDELSVPGKLEEMQQNPDELDEPIEALVLNKAIQLRNQFKGMAADEVEGALDRVYEENIATLTAAELMPEKAIKRATAVLDELLLAYHHMVNYNSTAMDRVASAINQVNFVGMLGFSLSSGLVNMVQTPGVAMPVAAGKFGVGPVVKEFGKAFNEFMSAVTHKRYDEDGNASISAVLYDQLQDSTNRDEKERLKDELWALEIFKNDGDVSRTRTFDIMGVGQEGETYGGRFHDFALKAGWMFHHGERFNREVTLMASYRLARQKGESHDQAIAYARYVNNRAHLDYSSENAARIFRGPLAKIALQFKKYQQGMLYLWTRTAIDAWQSLKREDFAPNKAGELQYKEALKEQKESRRTFIGLLAMQTSLAGAMGLPMVGMLGVCYEMIANAFGDDDEPHELEKDVRLGLAKIVGPTAAEAFAKGLFNTFTPVNAASRFDLSDLFFKAPLKELEGRDAATQYVAEVMGPFGGTVAKAWQGLSLMADGEWVRGLEQITPKALGDLVKAGRFAAEGVKTLDNMPLKDTSFIEESLQAIGFGSSATERRYAERGYAKGEEAAIKETRTKILRAVAWAKIKGERPNMQAIRDWNRKHPEKPIKDAHISASVKGLKESVEKRKERGYVVDPKLEYLYEENEIMD